MPKQVVVHRPTSEMNKRVTGSGFTSLRMRSGLASPWASEIGKHGRGVSPLKSPNVRSGFWVLVGTYWHQSLLYRQVVGDFDPELGIGIKRPSSLIPSGISFPNTCIGSLLGEQASSFLFQKWRN